MLETCTHARRSSGNSHILEISTQLGEVVQTSVDTEHHDADQSPITKHSELQLKPHQPGQVTNLSEAMMGF